MAKKKITITDFSKGINVADQPLQILDNQISDDKAGGRLQDEKGVTVKGAQYTEVDNISHSTIGSNGFTITSDGVVKRSLDLKEDVLPDGGSGYSSSYDWKDDCAIDKASAHCDPSSGTVAFTAADADHTGYVWNPAADADNAANPYLLVKSNHYNSAGHEVVVSFDYRTKSDEPSGFTGAEQVNVWVALMPDIRTGTAQAAAAAFNFASNEYKQAQRPWVFVKQLTAHIGWTTAKVKFDGSHFNLEKNHRCGFVILLQDTTEGGAFSTADALNIYFRNFKVQSGRTRMWRTGFDHHHGGRDLLYLFQTSDSIEKNLLGDDNFSQYANYGDGLNKGWMCTDIESGDTGGSGVNKGAAWRNGTLVEVSQNYQVAQDLSDAGSNYASGSLFSEATKGFKVSDTARDASAFSHVNFKDKASRNTGMDAECLLLTSGSTPANWQDATTRALMTANNPTNFKGVYDVFEIIYKTVPVTKGDEYYLTSMIHQHSDGMTLTSSLTGDMPDKFTQYEDENISIFWAPALTATENISAISPDVGTHGYIDRNHFSVSTKLASKQTSPRRTFIAGKHNGSAFDKRQNILTKGTGIWGGRHSFVKTSATTGNQCETPQFHAIGLKENERIVPFTDYIHVGILVKQAQISNGDGEISGDSTTGDYIHRPASQELLTITDFSLKKIPSKGRFEYAAVKDGWGARILRVDDNSWDTVFYSRYCGLGFTNAGQVYNTDYYADKGSGIGAAHATKYPSLPSNSIKMADDIWYPKFEYINGELVIQNANEETNDKTWNGAGAFNYQDKGPNNEGASIEQQDKTMHGKNRPAAFVLKRIKPNGGMFDFNEWILTTPGAPPFGAGKGMNGGLGVRGMIANMSFNNPNWPVAGIIKHTDFQMAEEYNTGNTNFMYPFPAVNLMINSEEDSSGGWTTGSDNLYSVYQICMTILYGDEKKESYIPKTTTSSFFHRDSHIGGLGILGGSGSERQTYYGLRKEYDNDTSESGIIQFSMSNSTKKSLSFRFDCSFAAGLVTNSGSGADAAKPIFVNQYQGTPEMNDIRGFRVYYRKLLDNASGPDTGSHHGFSYSDTSAGEFYLLAEYDIINETVYSEETGSSTALENRNGFVLTKTASVDTFSANTYTEGSYPTFWKGIIDIKEPPRFRTYELMSGRASGISDGVVYKHLAVSEGKRYVSNSFHWLEDGTKKIEPLKIYKSLHGTNIFPHNNYIEVATAEGEETTALYATGDRLLQFTNNYLHIINVSRFDEYLESSKKGQGVTSEAAICDTPYGLAFVNQSGVFLFDGNQSRDISSQAIPSNIFQGDLSLRSNNHSDENTKPIPRPMICYSKAYDSLIVIKQSASGWHNDKDNYYFYNSRDKGSIYVYNFKNNAWSSSSNALFSGDLASEDNSNAMYDDDADNTSASMKGLLYRKAGWRAKPSLNRDDNLFFLNTYVSTTPYYAKSATANYTETPFSMGNLNFAASNYTTSTDLDKLVNPLNHAVLIQKLSTNKRNGFGPFNFTTKKFNFNSMSGNKKVYAVNVNFASFHKLSSGVSTAFNSNSEGYYRKGFCTYAHSCVHIYYRTNEKSGWTKLPSGTYVNYENSGGAPIGLGYTDIENTQWDLRFSNGAAEKQNILAEIEFDEPIECQWIQFKFFGNYILQSKAIVDGDAQETTNPLPDAVPYLRIGTGWIDDTVNTDITSYNPSGFATGSTGDPNYIQDQFSRMCMTVSPMDFGNITGTRNSSFNGSYSSSSTPLSTSNMLQSPKDLGVGVYKEYLISNNLEDGTLALIETSLKAGNYTNDPIDMPTPNASLNRQENYAGTDKFQDKDTESWNHLPYQVDPGISKTVFIGTVPNGFELHGMEIEYRDMPITKKKR